MTYTTKDELSERQREMMRRVPVNDNKITRRKEVVRCVFCKMPTNRTKKAKRPKGMCELCYKDRHLRARYYKEFANTDDNV